MSKWVKVWRVKAALVDVWRVQSSLDRAPELEKAVKPKKVRHRKGKRKKR